MKRVILLAGLAASLFTGSAEAGCVKGAVIGGVAGHFMHRHTVIGAISGCAIGHHMEGRARRERKAREAAATAVAAHDATAHR